MNPYRHIQDTHAHALKVKATAEVILAHLESNTEASSIDLSVMLQRTCAFSDSLMQPALDDLADMGFIQRDTFCDGGALTDSHFEHVLANT